MLRASEFQTIQAQAVIYTPGLSFQTARVLAQLLGEYADAFNGEPITIPSPEGFPTAVEMPRFILQSRESGLRLQASPSRLDLFEWTHGPQRIRPLPEFLDWCLRLFDRYVEFTRARVGRLASVVARQVNRDEAAREIASHFCKRALLDGPLNRPSDFEVHAAKQFDLMQGFRINSWFRCKTAIFIDPQAQQQKAVLVEQDFNTLPEELETRVISRDEMREFFERVPDGFSEVLDLYFPEEGVGDGIPVA
jgi:hypothetical protein